MLTRSPSSDSGSSSLRCDVTMPFAGDELGFEIGRLLVLEHGHVLRQHDAPLLFRGQHLDALALARGVVELHQVHAVQADAVLQRVGREIDQQQVAEPLPHLDRIDVAARRHHAALALAVPIVEQPEQAGIADRGRIVQADEGHGVMPGSQRSAHLGIQTGLRRAIPVNRRRRSAVAPGAACAAARDRCRPGPHRPWRRRSTAAGSASAGPPPRAG